MTTRSFLGIPVEGEIQGGDAKVKQRPKEELGPYFEAVLSDPTVEAIRWTQYTPYFNDGDPCIFSAAGLYVLPDGAKDDTEDDDYEGYGEEESASWVSVDYCYDERQLAWLGKAERTYTGVWPDRVEHMSDYVGPDEDRYTRLRALNKAVAGGEFDHALQELFGDHCKVTVTRDKITVDEYSHD